MRNRIIAVFILTLLFATVDKRFFVFAQEAPDQNEQAVQDAQQTQSTQATEESQPANEPQDNQDNQAQKEKPHNPVVDMIIGSSSNPYTSVEKFQVEPSTGSATLGIPIEVPPGRKGIQPSISLMYNSGAGNGILGVGWSLELGSIQRSTKRGVPKYNDTDTFVLAQQGSTQELVSIGTNQFRAKIEGAFMKIEHIGVSPNDYWLVTDKKGIKYYFGQNGDNQNSRQNNPNPPLGSTNATFRWSLDKVEDLYGNYMAIEYFPNDDTHQVYPHYIRYTGLDGIVDSTFALIEFEKANRSDITTNYRSGFLVKTSERITNIKVNADGQLQKRYELNYDASSAKPSLLTSIKQYGQDGSSLPPTTFNYQIEAKLFNTATVWDGVQTFVAGAVDNNIRCQQTQAANGLTRTYVDMLDMNGDGLPDRVIHIGSNGWYVQLNNGSGFDPHVIWDGVESYVAGAADNNIRCQQTNSDGLTRTYVDMLDMNGDGLPDRVVHIGSNGWYVQLNNGSGFDPHVVWDGVETFVAGAADNNIRCQRPASNDVSRTYVDIFDINGDGLPDRVVHIGSNGWYVQLNNGSGFNPHVAWDGVETFVVGTADNNIRCQQTQTANGLTRTYVDILDINGDGLPDRVAHVGSNGWYVQLNNGSGFDPHVVWDGVESYVAGAADNNIRCQQTNSDSLCRSYVDFFDINGDGLPDRVVHIGSNGWYVQLNNGSGFNPHVVWDGVQTFVAGAADNNIRCQRPAGNDITRSYVDMLDINGDGLPDRVVHIGSNGWYVQLNTGPYPNLLATINNGVGASTQISYTPSTQYDNTLLPFPIQTVSSITATDNVYNQSYTTDYEYAAGLWKGYPDSEFRGFGEVKVIDCEGNFTKTTFEQNDNYEKGRTLSQETWGYIEAEPEPVLHLFAKTENTWDASDDLGAGSKFVYLSEVNNYSYEVGATGKRTKAQYFYEESPQYGDLTKSIDYGEVALSDGEDLDSTDNRISRVEYVYNSANWLLGLPKANWLQDYQGNILKQSWAYYDNLAYGATPTLGNLTKQENWLKTDTNQNPIPGASDNPTSTFTYDTYNNLLTSTDALGHTSTIEYDTTYHMFPIKTTNALNHNAKTIYYGINDNQTSGEFIDPYLNQGSGLWGQAKVTIDPNNKSSLSIYDTFGRVIKSVSPDDTIAYPTSSIEYLLESTPIRIITHQREASGQPGTLDSITFYDGLGRAIQSKTESETANQFVVSGQTTYNSRGLPENKYLPFLDTDPTRTLYDCTPLSANPYAPAVIHYDALGRAIKTVNPDTTYSEVQYGELTTTTIDENLHKQKSYSDIFGRLIKKEEYTTDPVNPYATTLYTYDTLGNLKTTQDHLGNITTIDYDTLGRKTQMIDPDMGTWHYSYDKLGNLVSQIDNKDQEITFEYDELNRLHAKRYTLNAENDVTYNYDSYPASPQKEVLDNLVINSLGRLTEASYTSGGSTKFYYDDLGREIKSEKVIDATTYTVERTYDAAGRLLTIKYPDNSVVTYTYNSAGQIETVVSGAQAYVSNVDYNASGQITRIDYGNGNITQYFYDPLTLRLEHLVTEHLGSSIQDLTYAYDSVGNITSISDSVNTATQQFTYDALNRLETANNSVYGNKIYAYNQIGNMTRKGDLFLQYDQTGNAGPHAVTSTSGEHDLAFEYDANGNITKETRNQSTETRYEYDFENRLKEVKKNNQVIADYEYDGDGGRTKKVTYDSGSAPVYSLEPDKKLNRYVFEFLTSLFTIPEAEASPIMAPLGPTTTMTIYVGSLYEKTNGSPTKHIFLGSQRICSITGYELPVTSYYHTNHLGSTDTITNSLGDEVVHYEYEPYGQIVATVGSDSTDYKFTGKPLDDETGLYYYGARYYNPLIGRFITPDTIIQAPGNPQTLNRYTYCNNNPVNLIDPLGHSWWTKNWKSIVTIAVGIIVGVFTAGIGTVFYAGLLGSFWGGIASAATTGAIAGAFSGAVGAGLSGQDIVQGTVMGAGYGALSGAVFGGISKFGGKDWNWKVGLERTAMATVAGGGISELAGGSFADGAMFAGIVSGSDFVYRAIVSTRPQGKNVGASMKTAKEDGRPKLDVDGKPLTVDNHPDVIHDRSINNVGNPESAGAKGVGHYVAGETGPVMNTLGKYVPGFQGLSLAHDITGYNLTGTGLRGLLNYPTMPVIYGINAAGSLINDSPGMIGFYENYRERN